MTVYVLTTDTNYFLGVYSWDNLLKALVKQHVGEKGIRYVVNNFTADKFPIDLGSHIVEKREI